MSDTNMQWAEPTFDPESRQGQAFEQDRRQVALSLAQATDIAGLLAAASQIQVLVHKLVDRTETAESMTLFISILNDMLTRRVIDVAAAGSQFEGVRWCWISLGSEGRMEQTLSSDQDNGIIFTSAQPAEQVRASLLPLAQRINAALDACGFPLCTGQVMAGNPQWCLSLQEWKERFSNWIIEGDPMALLNSSIFFDLRPLHGALDLACELADWLGLEGSTNPRFLFQMAANSMRRSPPLGIFRKFIVEKDGKYPGTIDLKVNAATMFVDAARIYGLAAKGRASNTAQRFALAVKARRLHSGDAEKWIQSFYFIQMLRLKNQQRSYKLGLEMHNHVDPNALDKADRDRLLAALRQARALHKRLALDYPGSCSV
jgi:CBS domain-containing protein